MSTQIDHEKSELLQAFEQGELKSITSKSELAQFKAAARATAYQPLADRHHFALNDAQWMNSNKSSNGQRRPSRA